LVWSLAM